MIEYLNIHSIDLIATRVTKKITKEEFEILMNDISEKINRYGKVNWYYEMVDFEGWDLDALWKDLKFSFKNKDNFNRVAFVGENILENMMAQFSRIFTPAEIKYFNLSEREAAVDWIKYGIELKKSNT